MNTRWTAWGLGLWLALTASFVPACGTQPSPRCGPDNCAGCCDPVGGCQSGNARLACGGGGLACEECAVTQQCRERTCVEPSADGGTDGGCVCPGGCCDQNQLCRAGNQPTACGNTGAACVACTGTDTCQLGGCSSGTCPGCVDATGQCLPGNNTFACGRDGGFCSACFTGQLCAGGNCQ